MKTTLVAAAALLGGASAHNHQRHAHEAFHLKRDDPSLVCKEVVTTMTGTDFIWVPTPNAPPANPDSTSTLTSTAVATAQVSQGVTVTQPAATTPAAPVPTPAANTCETPGTYTFPASTVTVTNTTSDVVPSTTEVSPGTYTLGGVTTVVETATTVVCPYATVSTASGGVVTSVIQSTTYVCPAAGTYTIAPITTTVTTSETVTVPSITTILPGTYTAPAVTTVVETSTVVYCPFESVSDTPSSTPSSAAAIPSSAAPVAYSSAAPVEPSSAAPVEPSSAAPVESVASAAPVVSSSAPSVASPSPTVEASSSVASSSEAAPSATSGGILGGTIGSAWSLTYTPYNPATGDCQSAEAVAADVAAIAAAGFTSLRVYSTDCDTLPNVGSAAADNGLKMIVGIFISSAGCTNASPDVETQIEAFKSWAQWDLVEMFTVANEALNNGYCTASELVTLIEHVKSELPDYTGPYTTTDVVSAWQADGVADVLCDAVDFPSANIHSYFTSSVAPADAGDFVKSQLELVEELCGGKTGYVLESGFPTAGSTIGLNVPSVANQAIAIKSIIDTIGDRVVLFSMFNDLWKPAGSYGCEQSWGIQPDLFGTLGSAWAALVATK